MKIAPCLWFDDQAEEAAKLYTSIIPNSQIKSILRYGEAGTEVHGQAAGKVMVVNFELDGQPYSALNGGPQFTFNEAISLQIFCDTQEEIDRYWKALIDDSKGPGQCGWLKDRFGVSWQITPSAIGELLGDQSTEAGKRAMNAMLKMTKLNVDELRAAREGDTAAPH